VSGSGISWAICKSAPHSRQITMPAPHHSVFYRPDALPASQPTASKHWRHCIVRYFVNRASGCYSVTDRQVQGCSALLQRRDDRVRSFSRGLPAPVCTTERRPHSGLATRTVSLDCEVFVAVLEFHSHRWPSAATETALQNTEQLCVKVS